MSVHNLQGSRYWVELRLIYYRYRPLNAGSGASGVARNEVALLWYVILAYILLSIITE